MVSVFLNVYYVYVMIYRRSCQLQLVTYSFKIPSLNVTIFIPFLHSSNFCMCLRSVADFSELELQPQQNASLFLLARRVMQFGYVVGMRVIF